MTGAQVKHSAPPSRGLQRPDDPPPVADLHRQVLESMGDAVLVADAEGRIVYANPAVERIFGYRPEEILGEGWWEKLYAEEGVSSAIRSSVRELARGEVKPHCHETERGFKRKDGSVVIVAWRNFPGRPGEIIGVARDITRSQTGDDVSGASLLSGSRSKLGLIRALQAVIRQLNLRRTPEEVARFIGEESMRILGADRCIVGIDKGDGKSGIITWSSGLSDEYVKLVLAHSTEIPAYRAFVERKPLVFPDVLAHPGFATLREAVTREGYRAQAVYPLVSGDECMGAMGYHYDECHRFTAEEISIAQSFADGVAAFMAYHRLYRQITESEENYRTLVEATADVVCVVNREYECVYVSPSVARLIGYTAEEILGGEVPVWKLIPAEDRKSLQQALQSALQGEQSVTECRVLHPDGREICVESWWSPLEGGDLGISEVRAVARDVTDRKRLEEQLWQAQKMEVVGILAGGIAHDFNNLLTGILGSAQLALEDCNPDGPVRRDLDQIVELARRGGSLARGLLSFSRGDILGLRPVNLSRGISEFLPLLRRLLPESISLRFDPTSGSLPVRADLHALEQIVMNLCTNARDAMPEGGEIMLSTRRGRVPETPPLPGSPLPAGECAFLTVTDTGIGMEAQTAERAFDPFFTTKERGRGTGLGLAIVYRLVRQHGGTVTLQSDPGAGTVVTVSLPLSAEPVEAAPTELPVAAPHGGETLLVVEDEEMVRQVVARALRARGYGVLTAAEGYEALEIYQRHAGEIALVLTDAVMPRMGGWELCRRLRRMSERVKLLVMSGYAPEEQTAASGEGEEEIEVLAKPLEARSLARRVRELLDAGAPPEEEEEDVVTVQAGSTMNST